MQTRKLGRTGLELPILAFGASSLGQEFRTVTVDDACPIDVPLQTRRQPVAGVMVNAFGFGGNNCSLVFGAGP